jgi:trans-2,3-dihydro-3-hydroxyanthranilate isomerase
MPPDPAQAMTQPASKAMTRPFYIVDVFAERPYAGNQLAVVLDADGLPEEAMRRIAAETNYSETAFVTSTPERDGAFRVRLFTPAREIDFAGHPLLGSGWVIRHHLLPNASSHVCLRIAAGDISVSFESSADGREVAWFRAPPVSLGQTCTPARIAAAVGVSPEDIATDAPIQGFRRAHPP